MEVTASSPFGSVTTHLNDEAASDATGQKDTQKQDSAADSGGGTSFSNLRELLPDSAVHPNIARQLAQSAIRGANEAANFVQTTVRANDAGKQQLGQSIDSAEKFLENKIDDGRAWLREHGGVVGQALSDQIGLGEGIDVSVYDAGKGLVQMADGAASLVSPLEWAANPQPNIDRVKTAASSVETLGKLANLATLTGWMADPQGNAQLAGALGHSAAASFEKDPAKFTGNAIGTVGMMLVPGGGEAAVTADVARGTRLLSEVADVAATAGKVDRTVGLLAGQRIEAAGAETIAANGIGTAEEIGIPKFLSPRQDLHIPPVYDGRSVLTADPAELLQGLHDGSFTILRQPKLGQVVVDFGKPIGEYWSNGARVDETQFGSVSFGKKGAHIIPANPNQW